MTPPPATTFSPSPEQADHLLTLYLDPSHSLSDLAREAGATLPALHRWLTSPDTAARLDELEAASARRLRAVAAQHLPAAVPVLTSILTEHRRAQANDTLPSDPELRRRAHETARRAAALLTRLARFAPGTPRPARQAGDERPPRLTASSTPAHAGDEAPPEPPPSSPPPSTPTPEGEGGRCEAHPRVSPSSISSSLNDTPHAGDERPPQPPLSCPSPSTANPRVFLPPPPPSLSDTPASDPPVLSHNSVVSAAQPPPSTPELDDPNPATLALLERLAEIPEDCPDDQLLARVTAALQTPPISLREAG